jgi:hypothetical protein
MACSLFEELWLLIFEQVLGPCEQPDRFGLPGRERILPLLLVCKQWQVRGAQQCFIDQNLRRLQRISEPLMYRHVHTLGSFPLRSLDEKISDLSKARGIDIWRWVQTFVAEGYYSSKDIKTLLTRTVNVVEIDISIVVSSKFLVTLRQCCLLLL